MIDLICGGDEDLLGKRVEVPNKDGPRGGTVTKRKGGLVDTFPPWDVETVSHYWKVAVRKEQLLIIHMMAGGWAQCSVVPPHKFDIEQPRIMPKYRESDGMGVRIKPQTMYIFANDDVLEAAGLGGNDGRSTKHDRPTERPKQKADTPRSKNKRKSHPASKDRRPTKRSGSKAKPKSKRPSKAVKVSRDVSSERDGDAGAEGTTGQK